MTNALSIYSQFDQLQKAAIALQASGYFRDVSSQAQAIVKVMAGAELGLPPFASMTGINIIQGKPVLGANVIATLVKNDPRYDYRVKLCTDQECIIEWFDYHQNTSKNGEVVGESSFTMAEAKRAGLNGKDNWTKYPSDMLFARAISRGARRFAPGIFGGSPVYTPDEMGADVDADGNVVVEAREASDQDYELLPETTANVSKPAGGDNGKADEAAAAAINKLGVQLWPGLWDEKKPAIADAYRDKKTKQVDMGKCLAFLEKRRADIESLADLKKHVAASWPAHEGLVDQVVSALGGSKFDRVEFLAGLAQAVGQEMPEEIRANVILACLDETTIPEEFR